MQARNLEAPSRNGIHCVPMVCYKEAQWWAGQHKQELERETSKGTPTGE